MSDLQSACIGAHAAHSAALWTFAAGCVAILSAAIGAWAAIHIAGVQARTEREHYVARVAAYWWRMKAELVPVVDDLEKAMQSGLQMGRGNPALPPPIRFPPALSSDEWENHALLGEQSAEAIAAAREFVGRFNRKATSITHDNLAEDDPDKQIHVVTVGAAYCLASRFDIMGHLCTEANFHASRLTRLMEEPPPALALRRPSSRAIAAAWLAIRSSVSRLSTALCQRDRA